MYIYARHIYWIESTCNVMNTYTHTYMGTQAALFIVKVGDKKYNKKNGVKRNERSTYT